MDIRCVEFDNETPVLSLDQNIHSGSERRQWGTGKKKNTGERDNKGVLQEQKIQERESHPPEKEKDYIRLFFWFIPF